MSDDSHPPSAAVEEHWAQVDVFGHRQHWGRIAEVERFGAKMLRIEIPTTAEATEFEAVYYGGSAIFSLTPRTKQAAIAWGERERSWRSPRPMSRLPAPSEPEESDYDSGNEDW